MAELSHAQQSVIASEARATVLADTAAELRADLRTERGRCEKLTEHIVHMRRAGYEASPLPSEFTAPEPHIPADIDAAIEKIAGRNRGLRKELEVFVEGQLRARIEHDTIIEQVKRGMPLGELDLDEGPED